MNKTHTLQLLFISFTFIALRPLIELFPPQSQVETVAMAGIWGILFSLFSTATFISFILNHKYISRGSAWLIFLFILMNGLFIFPGTARGAGAIMVEGARFFTGFSIILLLPPFISYSKDYPQKYSKTVKWFYYTLSICLIPGIIITFIQFLGIAEGPYGLYLGGRAHGGFYHPSNLGRYMIFLTFFTLVLKKKKIISAPLCYLSLFVAIITSYISEHRTSFMLVMLAIVFITSFNIFDRLKKKGLNSNLKKIFLFLLFCLIMIVILLTAFIYHQETFLRPWNSLTHQLHRQTRLIHFSWEEGLNISPAFLRNRGEQWDNILAFMNKQEPGIRLFGTGERIYDAHNDWLHRYLVSGLMGLIFYFVFTLSVLTIFLHKTNTEGKFYMLTAFLVYFLWSIPIKTSGSPNFIWLFFSFLMCCKLYYNSNYFTEKYQNQSIHSGTKTKINPRR